MLKPNDIFSPYWGRGAGVSFEIPLHLIAFIRDSLTYDSTYMQAIIIIRLLIIGCTLLIFWLVLFIYVFIIKMTKLDDGDSYECFGDGDSYEWLADGDSYWRLDDGHSYEWLDDGDSYECLDDGDSYWWLDDGDLYEWLHDAVSYEWFNDGDSYEWLDDGDSYELCPLYG